MIPPARKAEASRYLIRKYHEFWTPTEAAVAKAEKRIAEYIGKAEVDRTLHPGLRRYAKKIKDLPTAYVRQYVGAHTKERKIILCVGNTPGLAIRKGEEVWRKRFVFWYDAASTWRIEYDVASDRCQKYYHDLGF